MRIMGIFGNRAREESVTTPQKSEEARGVEAAMVERSALLQNREVTSTHEIRSPTVTPEVEKSEGIIGKICNLIKGVFYSQFNREKSKSAKAIKGAMLGISAVPFQLKSSVGMKLNGMHFTADDFMKKLSEARVERVAIECKAPCKQYSAMVLDPKNPGVKELLKNFEEMGFTEKVREDAVDGRRKVLSEGFWEKKTIDGKVYLFRKEELAELKRVKNFFKEGTINREVASVSTLALHSHAEGQKRKTIVLNGGVNSFFASNRTAPEVAKLLSLGFDVVVSDDKDKRRSDCESRTAVEASRDALYTYLKGRGLENSDIVWKGVCHSAVPAAEAAARYPGSHVWIDQGYYDSSDVVAKNAPFAKGLLGPAVRLAAPHVANAADFYFSMEEALAGVKGDVILVRNDNDNVIEELHHKRMRERLMEAGSPFESIHITDERVVHAGNCFIDLRCAAEIESRVAAKGWTPGALII